MRLADNRAKLEEKLKSAKIADLTLTLDEAMRIVAAEEVTEDTNSTGDAGASGLTGSESKSSGNASGSTSSGSGAKGGGRKASKSPIQVSGNIDDVTLHLVELLQALKEEKPEEANGAVNELMKLLRLIGPLPETELKKAA
jgi:hypothetical protein